MRTYAMAKVNTKRPRFDQIHVNTLAELQERNGLDRELYLFGETLFARQLSKIDLSMEIQEFRRRCNDRSMRARDAGRNFVFARWKKLRRLWSPYRFLG